ncbi:MAG: hypothetical protein ACKN9V_09410 [Pseudomonadota bacterium]
MKTSFIILLFWGSANCAFGDYAWIPKPETLVLKTGWELFKSENNFDANGTKRPLSTNSTPSTLTQNQVLLDAEYGLSDQWSGILKTSFLSAQINGLNSNFSSLSGSGLFDTALGFKWQMKQEKPVLALETTIFLPPYSTKNLEADQLALGDGTSSILIRLHGGTKLKRFAFSLSPGLLFRFGQFSNQAVLDSAISIVFRKFFFRVFESAGFSMTKESTLGQGAENLQIGSGGSFSRLALQPDLLVVGLKSGVFLSPKFRLEATISQTVWGQSAADGLRLGLTLVSNLDFSKPDTREPVREVPLGSE